VLAKVDPEFEIVPEEVDFGAVSKGETPTATVLLRQVREKPVKVTQVEPYGADTFKDVTYSFSERPESQWAHPDRAEYEIQVTLMGTISPGPFTRYFNILTNVDRLPFIRVPVTGMVNSFYAVEPQYPQRLMLQAGEGGKHVGVARISADRPISIEGLEFDASKIAVEIVPGVDTQHAELQVSIVPGVAKGRIEEEVSFTIRTADGEFPDRIVARGFVID
ncbi:MAG: hypothetical protein IT368_06125, partial [Candidatus Hydrogenedentes bacterium]|nr:hypothetical protein [Candidatus Hydrogenedentota bacterium]